MGLELTVENIASTVILLKGREIAVVHLLKSGHIMNWCDDTVVSRIDMASANADVFYRELLKRDQVWFNQDEVSFQTCAAGNCERRHIMDLRVIDKTVERESFQYLVSFEEDQRVIYWHKPWSIVCNLPKGKKILDKVTVLDYDELVVRLKASAVTLPVKHVVVERAYFNYKEEAWKLTFDIAKTLKLYHKDEEIILKICDETKPSQVYTVKSTTLVKDARMLVMHCGDLTIVASNLPEDLLKFYGHFDEPVDYVRRELYQNIYEILSSETLEEAKSIARKCYAIKNKKGD